MNERIKKLRRFLDLTQQEFADKLGTTRNNIAGYEIGRRSPSEAVISLICRTFNVSDAWLRTGEGEMFVQRSEEDELATAVDRLITGESAEFKRRLVNALSTLKDEHWLLLEQKLKEIVGMRDAVPASAHIPTIKEEARAEAEPAADIASELAELKRQNQEMAAEIAAMKEEDAIKAAQSPSVSTGSFDPAQRAKK